MFRPKVVEVEKPRGGSRLLSGTYYIISSQEWASRPRSPFHALSKPSQHALRLSYPENLGHQTPCSMRIHNQTHRRQNKHVQKSKLPCLLHIIRVRRIGFFSRIDNLLVASNRLVESVSTLESRTWVCKDHGVRCSNNHTRSCQHSILSCETCELTLIQDQ